MVGLPLEVGRCSPAGRRLIRRPVAPPSLSARDARRRPWHTVTHSPAELTRDLRRSVWLVSCARRGLLRVLDVLRRPHQLPHCALAGVRGGACGGAAPPYVECAAGV